MATEEGRPTVTFETQAEVDAYVRGWNDACKKVSEALAESAAVAASKGDLAVSLTLAAASGIIMTKGR